MNGKVTYRQQYTRCGKQRCRKCKEGAGHGPYWYAYWSENGRTISKYIGIHPPTDLVLTRQMTETTSEKVKARVKQPDQSLISTETSLTLHNISERAPTAPPEIAEAKHARLGVFAESKSSQALLRVYLLGQFRVERKEGTAWRTVENRTWQRRRARTLLGCLLSQTGRRMGREQVMEALWPDLDIETAANRLNGAVHELRQILEPGIERPASSKLLRLERDILILADSSSIWVDAESFETLVNRANSSTDPELTEDLLESAWTLYEGDYLLEELYSEWATSRRESLRRSWMGLLLKLAELRAKRGRLISAIEPLDRLLAADPTHETAVRRLMLLLTQLDRRGEAIRIYERLEALLKRDYDNEPLPETVELYKTLRQGPRVPTAPLPELPEEGQDQALSSANGFATAYKSEVPPAISDQYAAPTLVSWPAAHHPASSSGRHNRSPLSGRDTELEAIRQILHSIHQLPPQARQREQRQTGKVEQRTHLPHLAMIMGETGIGKTRLAEEIAQDAHGLGWRVAWTRAYEQEGTIPYRLWTDILRTLLQDVPQDELISMIQGKTIVTTEETANTSSPATSVQAKLARLSAFLPEIVAPQILPSQPNELLPALSPEQERFHLWETVLTILNTLSQSTPLLLVLDDLHWTDDSSLELLAYMARHQQNERIMLIGTCRARELAPSGTLRALLNDLRREGTLAAFPLEPLTPSQIARLVAHLPHEVVRGIQSQAGGNPLFAEELARFSETTQGKQRKENGSDKHLSYGKDEHKKGMNSHKRAATLPETIAAVLERRLNELSTECQTLLSKAAILGGSFEFGLLLHLIGAAGHDEDRTFDLLEEALHSGLLTEEVTGPRIVYHFWHPLIVSHLYERLSAARRAQLHRRTAEALIDLYKNNPAKGAAAIAHHLDKYGQDKQRLAHYAEIAGNQAMALSARSEALHYYRMALEARQALQAANPTLEQDPMHLANLLECIAECNTAQGHPEEAREQYAQVLELHKSQRKDASMFAYPDAFDAWQQEEAQIQAMILRSIGCSWKESGDYSQPHECAEQGRQILQAAGITSGIAWACLLNVDGAAYWAEGNFTEAQNCLEESLTILEAGTRSRQAGTANQSVSLDSSLPPLITRSQRTLLGDPGELSGAHDSRGVVAASMGQYAEAIHHLQIALAIDEEHDLIGLMGHVCNNLGAVHSMRAEYALAQTYYQRALQFAERTGDINSQILVTVNLGCNAATNGELQAATAWMMDSLALAEQVGDRRMTSWILIMLALTELDLGNMRLALEHLRRALVAERGFQNPGNAGLALAALADWRVARALMLRELDTVSLTTPAYRTLQSGTQQRLLRAAKKAIERALAIEGFDAEALCNVQLSQVNVLYHMGELELASALATQVLATAQQNDMFQLVGLFYRLLGDIQSASACYEAADFSYAEAIKIFTKHEMRLYYARTLQSYGSSLLARSLNVSQKQKATHPTNTALLEKARASLRQARDLFETCQASHDLAVVEQILTHPALLSSQLLSLKEKV